MTGRIIGILVCLFFSAFFSATETAFTSLNRIRIKNMANDGDRRARRVLELSDNYDSLLSTILIGNNIVNIALTAMATVLFITLYPIYGATVSTVVTTVVVLIFGEISPKSLAKEYPEKFAMAVAPFIKLFMIVLYPVNIIFSGWKKLLAVVFKVKNDTHITEDELITIVEEAETEGGINEAQSELIQNAIEFNELEAWDVLKPRVDIVAIDITTPKEEIQRIFMETGYSRLPVYEEDLDRVLGVLNQKDCSNYIKDTDTDIREYVMPVLFCSGSIKLSLLLKRLQKEKSHMAIIVDEYGGTAGLLTMEDIIEELVGEIYDEHDAEEDDDIVLNPDGSYTVKSSANLEKIFDRFDVEEEIDATTVNGWVMIELDKLPEVNDSFTYEADYKRFDVTVLEATERKSIKIRLLVTELEKEE
ncbi:MAG: hemolysin family protein [Clostridia bacterium]|nr:hemolysin family protein [Clostridia bacterium]